MDLAIKVERQSEVVVKWWTNNNFQDNAPMKVINQWLHSYSSTMVVVVQRIDDSSQTRAQQRWLGGNPMLLVGRQFANGDW